MSHLSTLSDFIGRIKRTPVTANQQTRRKDTEYNENEMNETFAGMAMSLATSRSRINRNKKIIKRNLVKVPEADLAVEEDLSAKAQSLLWQRSVSNDRMGMREENGWDTDLEIEEVVEGFDHSGRRAYIEACQRSKVVPVSYYLRHMHDPELKLRHHQLGSHAIKPIAISLVSNAKILSLDLTDNALGYQGGQALCEMLRENCFITHLNLSENHLGPATAELIAQILVSTTSLTHVTLSQNQFDDRAASFFAEAIMNTTKVEYLNLSNNQFSEASGVLFGPAIAENSTIKELDLSWNCFRAQGAIAIANGIKNNVMIKKINLSWNGFGVDGSRELGKALAENRTLEELDISNNRITTEGAVLFGKGMAATESLIKLKIGKNPMQSAGCWAICSALLKNQLNVVQELDFEDVLVNKDFYEVIKELQKSNPGIKINHGGIEPPKKPKAKVHPIIKLQRFISKNNLKLIDFFQKFDTDGSMSVSHSEFREGIEQLGINLQEDEILALISELDKDGDGEINYRKAFGSIKMSELVIGNQEFTENVKREQSKVLQSFLPSPSSTILRTS